LGRVGSGPSLSEQLKRPGDLDSRARVMRQQADCVCPLTRNRHSSIVILIHSATATPNPLGEDSQPAHPSIASFLLRRCLLPVAPGTYPRLTSLRPGLHLRRVLDRWDQGSISITSSSYSRTNSFRASCIQLFYTFQFSFRPQAKQACLFFDFILSFIFLIKNDESTRSVLLWGKIM
jgi:hypothetical protein